MTYVYLIIYGTFEICICEVVWECRTEITRVGLNLLVFGVHVFIRTYLDNPGNTAIRVEGEYNGLLNCLVCISISIYLEVSFFNEEHTSR